MDAVAAIGRNSKHQIQPEYGDEQTDAGQDYYYCCRRRNRLARPNKFSKANRYREILIFPVQLTTSRIDNLNRLILTFAI